MAQDMLQRSWAKLRSAIEDKALKLPSLVVDDLQDMAKTLEDIEAGVVEAERHVVLRTRMPTTAAERDWLKHVRKACYDITDMVDGLQSTPAGKIKKRMLPSLALKKNRTGNKVKDIKEELWTIREVNRQFTLMPSSNTKAVQQTTVPEAEEGEETIIGRGHCVEVIMAALSSSTASTIIMPIVGFHGIGKTTLARMVFKHAQFQEYNSRVWVHVSPEFDLSRIADSIIYQVLGGGGGGGETSYRDYDGGKMEEDITKRLHGLFAGKKILIVLDDIWEQDPVQLRNLKQMLTNATAGNGKAVVIVTTAIGGVARDLCTGVPLPYYTPFLTDDVCWTIIKQASRFLALPQSKRRELEETGQQIAKSCRGLPAAAREAGHALFETYRVEEWRLWAARDPEAFVNGTQFMMLCYVGMPQSMKLCFAYCAVVFFPAADVITKDDMVHQWIALDLVQPSGECSATQVAEEYIRRLSEMSFLRATKLPSTPTSGNHDKGMAMFSMTVLAYDLARHLMFGELIVLDQTSQAGTSWQKEEYCRYAVLTGIGMKPSSVLPSQLRVLRCVDCSKMEFNDDSFSFARRVRVLELKKSSMQKLPDSICELRHLGYLNLSGCPGLLTLPESLGHLVNMLHINLSGCSGLANLPESFGDLTKLLHVDLSRCCGLMNLPRSFRNLKSLAHLDLSFWSCFEMIQTTLGGLTSLQHLNLSHPCCYLGQHRSHLQGLKDVLGKLTKLRYLNLSMLLNPVFYYQSEDENHKYIKLCISSLSSLEHLDLSHNIFLSYLPGSLGKLSNLRTLDLSGCIRLKKIEEWMGEIESLKLNKCRGIESFLFAVHSDDSSSRSSLVRLEHVNSQELEIRCLEKVKSTDEARMIMMAEKWKVERLKLCWTMGSQGSVDDNALLGRLRPPQSLKCLELHGYNSEELPDEFGELTSLRELQLSDCTRLRKLPKSIGNSLHKVAIERCPALVSLPPKLINLKDLHIMGCPSLEQWIEFERKKIDEVPRQMTLFSNYADEVPCLEQ